MHVADDRAPGRTPDPADERPTSTPGPVAATMRMALRAIARPPATLLILIAALVGFTVLAAGPLLGFDRALHQPWKQQLFPSMADFVQNYLDPVAGQTIAVPVLGVITVAIAWHHRSWRPLVLATITELGVSGLVGLLKLGLARPSPVLNDPHFFDGGFLAEGWHGTSYPSGHAAQAVALYGVAVYLIIRYTPVSRLVARLMCTAVGLLTAMTMLCSLYLGWHWATDLLGGVITGAIALRTAVWLDRAVVANIPVLTASRHTRSDVPARTRPGTPEPVPAWALSARQPAEDVAERSDGPTTAQILEVHANQHPPYGSARYQPEQYGPEPYDRAQYDRAQYDRAPAQSRYGHGPERAHDDVAALDADEQAAARARLDRADTDTLHVV